MTRKPSILFVIPYGFNDRLMNFMDCVLGRTLARDAWYVCGVTRNEGKELSHQEVFGVDVHRYRSTFQGIFLTARILLALRPDVVHIITLRNNRTGTLAAVLAKILRVPFVCTEAGLLHDHYLVDDREDPIGKLLRYDDVIPSIRSLLARSMRNPVNFLFYSRSYLFHWPLTHADHCVFFSKHNMPIAEALRLRNSLYLPQILDDVTASDAAYEIKKVEDRLPPGPFALFVGQLKARKGWDILLQAIPLIPQDVVPYFVIVSSTGFETPEYTRLVAKLGIANRIFFLGAIKSRAALRHIFDRSCLIVVPSLYEGFGLVPLDAFDASKPVVASKVEALTDFLEHDTNAYLIPPKDPAKLAQAICHIANTPETAHRLVHGGEQTLRLFRDHSRAQLWLDFYRSLLTSSKK